MESEGRVSAKSLLQWLAAPAWTASFVAAAEGGSFLYVLGGAFLVLIALLGDKAVIMQRRSTSQAGDYRLNLDKRAGSVLALLEAFQLLLFLAGAVALIWWLIRDEDIALPLSQLLYAHKGTRFFITPDAVMIYIPLMFASVTAVVFLVVGLPLLLAGRYRREWKEYTRLRDIPGLDTGKPHQLFLRKWAVANVLCVFLFLGAYLRVTDKGVGVHHPWSISERFYDWNSIRKIEKVQWLGRGENAGKVYYHYVLTFSNGRRWRSEDSGFRSTRLTTTPAVWYIAAHSGAGISTRSKGRSGL